MVTKKSVMLLIVVSLAQWVTLEWTADRTGGRVTKFVVEKTETFMIPKVRQNHSNC